MWRWFWLTSWFLLLVWVMSLLWYLGWATPIHGIPAIVFSIGGLVIATGWLLNAVVISFNGYRMPAKDTDSLEESSRYCPVEGARLVLLGDIILIGNYFYSPGDILLRVGRILSYSGFVVIVWQALL